jgi:hypothetical protein
MPRRNRKTRTADIPPAIETAVITLSMYDALNSIDPSNPAGAKDPADPSSTAPQAVEEWRRERTG